MIYLLINHIPFGQGPTPAEFRVGDSMLADVRAHARAIREAGGRLIVAAPLLDKLTPAAAHSFGLARITPDAEGFEFFALPYYISLRQFWRVKRELLARLRQIIPVADIVQMDYGGHPMMLGELAWELAGQCGKRRIWVFDSVDPFPRFEAEARVEVNPFRRIAKRRLVQRKEEFCRLAIGQADLVFAFNDPVVRRFRNVWDDSRCHAFTRPIITDDLVLDEGSLEQSAQSRGGKSRALRVLCAGKQTPAKGTEHAIRALAHCQRLSCPIELTIVGAGADLKELQEMAGGLAMSDHVTFVDSTVGNAELLELLDAHDVLLMTNLIPEFDRQLLIAMGRGLAVVGYENTATDRLLESTDCGVVVPLENVLLLAQALIDLQQNPQRRRELSKNGWRAARTMTLQATHRRRAELALALLQPVT